MTKSGELPAGIETNVSLQAHNTLAIPAKAAYFAIASSDDALSLALGFASEHQLPVLVLGEGSNTVFSRDYPGMVILNRLRGIDVIDDTGESVTVRAAAGENWHQFVEYCLNQGWYGLENLALIPGLVGAAPIQNIGAYGVELRDSMVSVSYTEIVGQARKELSNAECLFEYRDSIFKNDLAGKTVITAVVFKLSKNPDCVVTYPALAEQLDSEPSPKQVFDAVCLIRRAKLPMPDTIPNAGSFFKNPVIGDAQHSALKQAYPQLVSFQVDTGFKLAAAWLIDKRGWKHKVIDDVCVHKRQALVITNPAKRPGASVIALANAIQKDIESAYDVSLEIEPRIY